MLEPSDLIRENILSALPSLPVESLGCMVEKLIQQGVETEEDLQYVREQDIEEFLKPIQCRKLLDAWKHKVSISAPPRQMSTCIPLDQTSSLSSSPMSSPAASPLPANANWPNTFKVNWDKMPPSLNTCIQNGKRPSPADRRQMIRLLVDDMRKIEVNPSRAQCLIIARDIARQYPQSFMDTMDDGRTTIGAGYESLLCQIKTRIEHSNRNNTLARRRSSKDANGIKPRGPADTYGCTQWQPELPPEETEASLEDKRQKLMELFSREGSSGMERAEVLKLMETTYSLQRQMINANPAPAFEDVKQQWPYLFFPRSMCTHFEVLTNVSIVRKIEAFLEEHGRNIMEFFKVNPTNDDVKAVLFKTDCSVTVPNILQVLMAHFKEPLDALIIQTDVSATPAIVQLTVTLPDTPRLIVAGPMTQTNQSWMLSIEKEVLCEGTSFVLGLAVLFSSFYNFNLQYQHDAACTLEFIQRSCIDINPERGTKASSEKVQSKKSGKMVQKKSTSVNPHVSTLIKKISDFKTDEWQLR
ncbi:Sterile alpha motif domain-containing protein 3 [Merluccius polli]|uniref:Sterile alpha motif domain-containing protein 3 n=1 Tax=Merluccius polli TaxID=89951 RepID=A0AA47NBS2_MERPO|nr:Sterile alpha motif domain-containing protein 3 [Merluccius polli]